MKPVFQTKLKPPKGNCLQACIASILEIPIDSLPPTKHEPFWFERLNKPLAKLGYVLVMVDLIFQREQDEGKCLVYIKGSEPVRVFPKNCFYIAGGHSPRGNYLHAVVCKDGKVVHDPYPGGHGFVGEPTRLYFLCPKIVTKMKKKVVSCRRSK